MYNLNFSLTWQPQLLLICITFFIHKIAPKIINYIVILLSLINTSNVIF